jgi:hypothetical protein
LFQNLFIFWVFERRLCGSIVFSSLTPLRTYEYWECAHSSNSVKTVFNAGRAISSPQECAQIPTGVYQPMQIDSVSFRLRALHMLTMPRRRGARERGERNSSNLQRTAATYIRWGLMSEETGASVFQPFFETSSSLSRPAASARGFEQHSQTPLATALVIFNSSGKHRESASVWSNYIHFSSRLLICVILTHLLRSLGEGRYMCSFGLSTTTPIGIWENLKNVISRKRTCHGQISFCTAVLSLFPIWSL